MVVAQVTIFLLPTWETWHELLAPSSCPKLSPAIVGIWGRPDQASVYLSLSLPPSNSQKNYFLSLETTGLGQIPLLHSSYLYTVWLSEATIYLIWRSNCHYPKTKTKANHFKWASEVFLWSSEKGRGQSGSTVHLWLWEPSPAPSYTQRHSRAVHQTYGATGRRQRDWTTDRSRSHCSLC